MCRTHRMFFVTKSFAGLSALKETFCYGLGLAGYKSTKQIVYLIYTDIITKFILIFSYQRDKSILKQA